MVVLKRVKNFLAPLPVVLVTARLRDNDKVTDNIIPISWTGIVESAPHMININISRGKYSGEVIKKTKQFVVAIPRADHIREVDQAVADLPHLPLGRKPLDDGRPQVPRNHPRAAELVLRVGIVGRRLPGRLIRHEVVDVFLSPLGCECEARILRAPLRDVFDYHFRCPDRVIRQ